MAFLISRLQTGTNLEVLNEKVPGCVVNHRVERIGIKSQRVVVVKAVDVHFGQADLIVGVDGRRIEGLACAGWN